MTFHFSKLGLSKSLLLFFCFFFFSSCSRPSVLFGKESIDSANEFTVLTRRQGRLSVNSHVGYIFDKSKQHNSDIEGLVSLDDSSPYEFGSRNYLLSPQPLHNGRINIIEVAQAYLKADGERLPEIIYTGGQDGSVYELVLGQSDSGMGNFQNGISFKSISLLISSKRPVLSLAVSPDRNYLAVSQFSRISIIDLTQRKLVTQFGRVKGRVNAMAWHPSGTSLLLGRANGDIFNWNIGSDFERAADSTDALELYETESSPVVKIEYHPSGRAVFVALQSGTVYLVRLVRTERELGLRLDPMRPGMVQGKYVVKVGSLPQQLNDMLLDQDSEELMASGSDGSVYRWGLRGLRRRTPFPLGSDSAGFISLASSKNSSYRIISSLGRNLRLRFWCATEEAYEIFEPTSLVLKSESGDSDSASRIVSEEDELIARLKDELMTELGAGAKNEDINADATLTPDRVLEHRALGLIAQSPRFLDTVQVGRYAGSSGILWIAVKSGSLVGFDVSSYLSSSEFGLQAGKVCRKGNGNLSSAGN
ncbi:MAG TPA: hypothetical protein PKA63_06285 [Oligoflexia bacterium]|nr:hypothetical protein [Oligoflexia bacterium]HMP48256.1 hypothetical protein [Oligoflexia bacterium]